VAIHVPKRPETIAALYGVLQAGGVVVPLDPTAPTEYVRSIAARCGASALIVDGELAGAWAGWLEHHPVRLVVLAGDGGEAVPPGSPTVTFDQAATTPTGPTPDIDAGALAWIIPTSGSTGTPKGVVHRHRALTEVARWTVDRIGIEPDDRVAVHPPLHFVLSAYALFPSVLAGATAVLVPEEQSILGWELLRLIEAEQITVWVSVPSALSLVRPSEAGDQAMSSLRAVVLSGESLVPGLADNLHRAAPDARLWSLYGTTEAWGIAYREVDRGADDQPRNLGTAWEGVDVVVVREDGSLAGVGDEGELFASSDKLMAGYWDDAEGTQRVLVSDPTGTHQDRVFYRTGDVVRVLPGGEYELVGRRDHQVTRRGYRVELTGIDAALEGHPDVRSAAAVAVPHSRRGSWITAFVLSEPGNQSGAPDLMAFLAERLPGHLLPDRIEVIDQLPRTPTGKVDRVALGAMPRAKP
jgi:amino acid adenylation domain-containing protein